MDNEKIDAESARSYKNDPMFHKLREALFESNKKELEKLGHDTGSMTRGEIEEAFECEIQKLRDSVSERK